MPILEGVRIGPMDPDSTADFGTVGAKNSAKMLIRRHAGMHPPQLVGVISRTRQNERSRVLDMGEVREAAEGRIKDDGQEVPEGFYITGAAVRGEDDKPSQQVVSFTYQLPSGRQGKGALPYNADTVPDSVAAGDESVRIADAKKHGLPFIPQQVADALAGAKAPDEGGDDSAVQALEVERDAEKARADKAETAQDDLQRQLDELKGTVAALQEAQANLAPAGPAGPTDVDKRPVEPFDGFGSSNPQIVKERLAAAEGAEQVALAQSVLAFEQGPDGSNRATVVKAANAVLDRAPGAQ